MPALRAGDQDCEPGEESPVSWLECGLVHLASKDRSLVAEHDDLDRKLAMVTAGEPVQLADAKKE